MLQALAARVQSAALRFTHLSKQSQSVAGFSLLGRHTQSAVLGHHTRRLLRGSLLGGAGAGAALFSETTSVLSSSAGLHTSSISHMWALQEMGLLSWFLVDLGINWVGWAVAAALKTEVFYDLLGSASFLALTTGSLMTGGAISARKLLVSGMVCVWTVRLGTYLVSRIAKTGTDVRFDDVKDKPAKFLVFWTMQALWVYLSLLPVLFINSMPVAAPLAAVDAIGILVYATGLTLEAVADAQKAAFKSRPENKGRFIDEGLWSLSQHPNYCGEMMIWWGIFLTCAPGFSAPWQFTAVLSPLVVMGLLRYVSGVPLLEAMAEQRWGATPEYQAYKARTHLLLPWPVPPSGAAGEGSGGKRDVGDGGVVTGGGERQGGEARTRLLPGRGSGEE